MFNITKKEIYLVIAVSFALFLITLIPIVYFYAKTPQGSSYLFIKPIISFDYAVYYSNINQIIDGKYLLKDLFSGENQNLGTLNIFWLGVGLFAKIFKLSPPLAFQIARLFCTFFGLFCTYLFISYLVSDKKTRAYILLFASFASGLDFIVIILQVLRIICLTNVTIGLSPEANIFTLSSFSPHFIFSYGLLILCFLFFLIAIEKNSFKFSLLSGICAFILSQFHPFHIFTILFVPFVFLLIKTFQNELPRNKLMGVYPKARIHSKLWGINPLVPLSGIKKINWNYAKHYFLLFFFCLPFFIYHYYLTQVDLFSSLKAMQNINLTPKFYYLFATYGLFIILSFLQALKFIKQKEFFDKYLFLTVWIVCSIILVYAPFVFQRRLLEGLNFPLFFLSGLYLIGWIQSLDLEKLSLKTLFKFLFLNLIIAVFLVTNVIYLLIDIRTLDLFYLKNSEKNAIAFLKQNSSENNIILASHDNSANIVLLSALTVFSGHPIETLNPIYKNFQVENFYKYNDNDSKNIQFLKENSISYVFYSDAEKKLGSFNPDEKDYLTKVFEENGTKVYLVK